MAELQRPAILKWRHSSPEVILCGVRWYLRYSLSYRDIQELLGLTYFKPRKYVPFITPPKAAKKGPGPFSHLSPTFPRLNRAPALP